MYLSKGTDSIHDTPDRSSPVTTFFHVAPVSVHAVYRIARVNQLYELLL